MCNDPLFCPLGTSPAPCGQKNLAIFGIWRSWVRKQHISMTHCLDVTHIAFVLLLRPCRCATTTFFAHWANFWAPCGLRNLAFFSYVSNLCKQHISMIQWLDATHMTCFWFVTPCRCAMTPFFAHWAPFGLHAGKKLSDFRHLTVMSS